MSAVLKNFSWRHYLVCVLPLCLVFAALPDLDSSLRQTIFFINLRNMHPDLLGPMHFVTSKLRYAFYGTYGILLLYAVWTKNKPLLTFVLAYAAIAIIVGVLLLPALKFCIGSPRPLFAFMGLERHMFSIDWQFHSFPSGHSTDAMSAAIALSTWFRKFSVSLLMGLMAALIAFSRVYLSWHTMTDVMAGMFLGSLAALAIHYLCIRKSI